MEDIEKRTSSARVSSLCLSIIYFRSPCAIVRGRYGHGVLRSPDPRFIALQEFVDTKPELQNSPIIQLVKKARSMAPVLMLELTVVQTFEVAPGVLTEHGKVRS
jgi:hypothetical protein